MRQPTYLVMTVRVDSADPAVDRAEEIAKYFLDPAADDPVPTLVSAYWVSVNAMTPNRTGW